MIWRRYNPGVLCKISSQPTFTSHGFATARAGDHDTIVFSEHISLESFPSCSDYFGREVVCRADQTATVLAFLGRPYRISFTAGWEYDVYEVLVDKSICQIFARNLVELMTPAEKTDRG